MSKPVPYRRLRFVAIHGLISLALLAGLSLGCSRQVEFLIPPQKTAAAQFAYAQQVEMRYRSLLKRDRHEILSREAIAAYMKVIEVFPDDTVLVNRSWLNIAMIYEKEMKLKKALALYERLLKDVPDDAAIQTSALLGAGKIYDYWGKYEKAMAMYDQIINHYGDSKDPMIQGIVIDAQRRFQQVRTK